MTQLPTQPQQQTQTRPAESELDRLMKLRTSIETESPEFAKIAPPNVDNERFMRAAKSWMMSNPDIARCSKSTIMFALMKCAKDGLLPDGKQAFINVFLDRKAGTYSATYQRMVECCVVILQRNYPGISLTRGVVYKGDVFTHEVTEAGRKIKHVPTGESEKDADITHAYIIASFPDGRSFSEVMSIGQINKRKAVSRSASSDYGPWKRWFPDMCKKSAIHDLMKTLPGLDLADEDDFDRDETPQRQHQPTLDDLAADILEPAPPREPGDDETE